MLDPYEIDANKNPIFRIISSFNELKYVLNKVKGDIFKFLYFNRKKIHYIIYLEEEMIQINKELIKRDLSCYFYLFLLLEDDPNIVNYEYSIGLIRDKNDELEKENNSNIFKDLIKSKLILELIQNYKELKYYDKEKDEDYLEKIENNILNKIKDSNNN